MIILDTHVWIWMVEGTREIGRRTRTFIDRLGARDLVRVSPLSVFEVAWLHGSGRIRLSKSVEHWVQEAMEPIGIRLAPLTIDVALDAGATGPLAVPDPIDRLIVATARQNGATLVTRDRRILDYAAATSAVRVHNAGV